MFVWDDGHDDINILGLATNQGMPYAYDASLNIIRKITDIACPILGGRVDTHESDKANEVKRTCTRNWTSTEQTDRCEGCSEEQIILAPC